MKEALLNFGWSVGVRAFRLTRKANLSTRLEPAFAKIASLMPKSNEPVEVTLRGGVRFLMPPGYRDTRSVVTGLFQADETRLLERVVRPGMTFVDVGSYVGYFTVIGAHLVGPAGRVFAFEPNRLAYEYLLTNIAANGYGNVSAVNGAVADRPGILTLVQDPTGPETFVSFGRANGVGTAEALSLDDFFAKQQWPVVDVMKMNIEGAELHALRGMRELSRRSPRLQLVMEHNPIALDRAGSTRSEMTAVLRELGFVEGRVVERGLESLAAGELLPNTRAVYNVLLTKQ